MGLSAQVVLYTPPPPPVPRPVLGATVHFPSMTAPQAEWDAAEAAVGRVRATFGPGAYVRWNGRWHETWWNPFVSNGFAQQERTLSILNRQGVRSLMLLMPNPWPGSDWDGGPTARDWGAPLPDWFTTIAARYRESVAWYKSALRARGMVEGENAVQWGNEPASGHPGGNGGLPRGTWSGHQLWAELHKYIGKGQGAFYGNLIVAAPALSMLDEPEAQRELTTARVPPDADWSTPVDRRAMHFRFYAPWISTPEEYARAYVQELARRAEFVLNEPFPTAPGYKGKDRAAGLWITEAYVASGDCPEPRAECWRRVLSKVRAGVPGVAGFFAYRFHPASGPGQIEWQVPIEAQTPVGEGQSLE